MKQVFSSVLIHELLEQQLFRAGLLHWTHKLTFANGVGYDAEVSNHV